MSARWVHKRSEAAVAAAGGVKLGRVLACIGTFILQLRRLRAARAAMATKEVATGDDVAAARRSPPQSLRLTTRRWMSRRCERRRRS